jgi:serine/threonine-protein kinase
VLFYIYREGVLEDAKVAALSLETGEVRILVENGTSPHYVPTGHIVYERAGSLMAVPFDVNRLQVIGSPAPVLEDPVRVWAGEGYAMVSLSSDGLLLYVPGGDVARKLVSVDRQGMERPLTETSRGYSTPRLSPDGQQLAVTIMDADGYDSWIVELTRGTLTRLTFEGWNSRPIWSADGERIIFGSNRVENIYNIFWKPADGSGAAEQLTMAAAYHSPTSISSDGKTIVFGQNSSTTGRDIGMVRLEGERQPEMLLQTPFDEHTGMLSPDDRWLAYVSNESGRAEIYVRPFPGPGGRVQISTEGGMQPMWSRDGRELFYRNGNKMMAVAITMEPELNPGKPEVLFEGGYQIGGRISSNYDVTPDGRFVMIRTDEKAAPAQINVVLNWFEELKRLAPVEN